MARMSPFAATGYALNAHDTYERGRRADRMAAFEEEKAQHGSNLMKLDLDIFKLGLMLTAKQQQEAAKAAQPSDLARTSAIQMVPSEAGGTRPISPYDKPETSYAQGGEVKPVTPKFSGIYDDTLADKEQPSVFELLDKDYADPSYKVGSMLPATADHFAGSLLALAEGGELPGIYNGVQVLAEGGEVEKPKKGKKAKKAAPKAPSTFTEYIAHYACGGHVKKMAAGGEVQGPGTGTSDSIPASLDGRQGAVRLSAGEYVLPKKMVDAIGVEKLDAMRKKYI